MTVYFRFPPKLKQEAKTEGECAFVLNIGKWILKSHSKKLIEIFTFENKN